jgi:hypothetical protein
MQEKIIGKYMQQAGRTGNEFPAFPSWSLGRSKKGECIIYYCQELTTAEAVRLTGTKRSKNGKRIIITVRS